MWDVDGILTSDISEHDKKVAAEERSERMLFELYIAKACAGTNPRLRKDKKINNARRYETYFRYSQDELNKEEKFSQFEALADLERILEKYAEEEQYTAGSFNIFMFTDEALDEIITKAKASGENIATLDEPTKILRRKEYNCGDYKIREMQPDDYVCV